MHKNLRVHWTRNNDSVLNIVNTTAKLQTVIEKLMPTEFLFCLDDKNIFHGLITRKDLYNYLCRAEINTDARAKDVANHNCAIARLEQLDSDLTLLQKFNYLPVLNAEGQYMFYVHKNTAWANGQGAQEFEIDWWEKFFENNPIDEDQISLDHVFVQDKGVISNLIKKTHHGVCLEIGAGPLCGYLPSVKNAAKKIIIEPLADQYAKLRQKLSLLIDGTDDIVYYSQGADVYIPELKNTIDVIICQNMLDHTPAWPFILSNIAAYAKEGAYLYLSTDIDHHTEHEAGHYNLTYDPTKLFHMLDALGFTLHYKDCWNRNGGNTCVSVVGEKRGAL